MKIRSLLTIFIILSSVIATGGCGNSQAGIADAQQPGKDLEKKIHLKIDPLLALAAPPLPANIFITDGDNNRIIEVNPKGEIVWQYGGKLGSGPGELHDPNDVQILPNKNLIVNDRQNDRVIEIDYRKKEVVWQYGQPGHPGFGPNQIYYPDEAFKLKDGNYLITDSGNHRVIILSPAKQLLWQYGVPGKPGNQPGMLKNINDAEPQPNGNILITDEGNNRIVEVNRGGQIVWQMALPFTKFPSDVLRMEDGHLLAADYVTPGQVVEFDKNGKIIWQYGPKSGPEVLNHPSSVDKLSNGNYLVSDDWNHRIVVINPAGQIVWQFGEKGVPGADAHHLNRQSGVEAVETGG